MYDMHDIYDMHDLFVFILLNISNLTINIKYIQTIINYHKIYIYIIKFYIHIHIHHATT